MKFKFKFAPVEKHRKIMMDLARREYLDAQNEVDLKLAQIKAMYLAIDEARERAEHTQVEGGTKSGELQQIEDFIVGQTIRIERARIEARALMQIAEEKHEILVEKVTDHKAMLKLRERHLETFKHEQKKISQKQADDQTIMRFKAREG